MKSVLASHVAQLMKDGRITDGRIYGTQHTHLHKKKMLRSGVQGVAGTKTGSGSNKPAVGEASGKQRQTVNQGAVLVAGKPKTGGFSVTTPKGVSAFMKAFIAAKNSLHTSTDSRAKAGGAKPMKGSTARTPGAGVD